MTLNLLPETQIVIVLTIATIYASLLPFFVSYRETGNRFWKILIVIGFFILLIVPGGLFNWFYYYWGMVFIDVLFTLLFLVYIGPVDRNFYARSTNASKLSNNFLGSVSGIDIAICKISYEIFRNKSRNLMHLNYKKILELTRVAITSVIDTMSQFIKSSERTDPFFSVLLVAADGKFELIANSGFSDGQKVIDGIEQLNYLTPYGLAGYAVFHKEDVFIPDLVTDTSQVATEWKPILSADEPKEGCIIISVIYYNVGNKPGRTPMGVICLTSKKQNQSKARSLQKLIQLMQPKLETLIYYYYILQLKTPSLEERAVIYRNSNRK